VTKPLTDVPQLVATQGTGSWVPPAIEAPQGANKQTKGAIPQRHQDREGRTVISKRYSESVT
jgi:hypothetical protein